MFDVSPGHFSVAGCEKEGVDLREEEMFCENRNHYEGRVVGIVNRISAKVCKGPTVLIVRRPY
jgi:hypothetical protein